MYLAWFFVGSLFYLAGKQIQVSSLSSNELDFARSVILDAVEDITAKPVKPSRVKSGWSGWSGSGRRRNSSKPRNLNKFNEVMDQVERAMTQAQLSKQSVQLAELKRDITSAVKMGNVRFARRALGFALHAAQKSSSASGRGKRSAADDAKKFLADIKRQLGKKKFSDFLALQGQVTLMYAVDITGSMREEIAAAKAIVTEITKQKRTEPVDYILSSFGDPIEQGSVVYKPDDEVEKFIAAIGGLEADGGGDCAEFAFEGMINALSEDPRWGSPLYVFTDAPPKDATEKNRETLQVLAEKLGVTINFFAHRECKQDRLYTFDEFDELAKSHGGQVLDLSAVEMKSMSGFTATALGGSTAVVTGSNESMRKKRSTTSEIAIPVDDTVSKLIVSITVTAKNTGGQIRLATPTGATLTGGKTVLSKVVVHVVNSPMKGIWKLSVPSSVGTYQYSAKVSSPENVDFEHYFTKIDRRGKLIPIRNPLAGEPAYVNITISGARLINKNSLVVDIIDMSGNVLIPNNKLLPVGKAGLRFTFRFHPPSKPFKLMLRGKTAGNRVLQRISRHVNRAKSLILKEYRDLQQYKIKKGQTNIILFYLFNSSPKPQKFDVLFDDTMGCNMTLAGRQRMTIRPKSKKYIRVEVDCRGVSGQAGKTENVIVILKGKSGGVVTTTTELVPLMFVSKD